MRLKPGVKATFHHAPGGGGGSGEARKRGIIGLIIAVATVLTAGAVAAGGIAALGIGGGTFGARVIAGGITLIGSLAAQAISAPPAARTPDREDARGPASVAGNVLRPGGSIPRVIGTRRIFPPLAAQPTVVRIDGDEIAEAVFALEGPHRLEDIRIGDAPVGAVEDVEIETREGRATDAPLGSVARIAHTETPNIEIAGHRVQTDNGEALNDQRITYSNLSLPDWHRVASRGAADEILLHLLMAGGAGRAVAARPNSRTAAPAADTTGGDERVDQSAGNPSAIGQFALAAADGENRVDRPAGVAAGAAGTAGIHRRVDKRQRPRHQLFSR